MDIGVCVRVALCSWDNLNLSHSWPERVYATLILFCTVRNAGWLNDIVEGNPKLIIDEIKNKVLFHFLRHILTLYDQYCTQYDVKRNIRREIQNLFRIRC